MTTRDPAITTPHGAFYVEVSHDTIAVNARPSDAKLFAYPRTRGAFKAALREAIANGKIRCDQRADVVGAVKRAKAAFLEESNSWECRLPADVVRWAWGEFGKLEGFGDYTCCDNRRVANMRKSSQRRRFVKARKSGCCGSHEWTATHDGVLYTLGFNYGH